MWVPTAPVPLLVGLGQRETASNSFSVGESFVLVLVDLDKVSRLEEVTLGVLGRAASDGRGDGRGDFDFLAFNGGGDSGGDGLGSACVAGLGE